MGRTRLIALSVATLWSAAVFAADWSALEQYQQTTSRAEFETFLTNVYCPSGAITNYLTFTTNSVSVFSVIEKTNPPLFVLRFSSAVSSTNSRPLSLKRIALDPGHIGGAWARMEERFFQRGKDRPVQEAELNLMVARLLKVRLEVMGA
jgi:N-acetylmuramoyl-L-alanine amidase